MKTQSDLVHTGLRRRLSRNHAIEGGDRFTRRREDAEKGH